MIDKFVRSVAEAMAGIKDGSTVLIAGFAQVGEPRALIDGLIEQGAKDLTVVHNTAGRGGIELEILPQGTMAERMRAAAAGIPAFYTATAAGTKLAQGKEARAFDGREYILEHWLPGDVALVEAWRADRWGNLVYRDAGRNFNPVMAAAAQLTIAQTQHIAELGELAPENIVTPGIYVDRIVHVAAGDPPIKIE